MIDYATYKQMHPHDPKNGPQVINQGDLGRAVMARDDPPADDSFLLCLPNTIPGFNMNKKEWSKRISPSSLKRANLRSANLDVSRLSSVKWNTEAFDSLVVDEETKELISALVTNQIDAEESTDLMSGKGNGLFILLHGWVVISPSWYRELLADSQHSGPGTGKTLTAERCHDLPFDMIFANTVLVLPNFRRSHFTG